MTKALAALAGLFLFVLVIYSGLHGTDAPDRNFSLTFVFVTFWLGMVGLSVLFGDVFRAFNPWRTIARAVSDGFRLIAGQRARAAHLPRLARAAGRRCSASSPSPGSS